MTNRYLAIILSFHLFTACLHGPGTVSAAETPTIRLFFQKLVQNYDPAALPKYEETLKVTDQVAGARPEDISAALPWIAAALAHRDDNVKSDAALALFAIGLRPDSATLLKQHVRIIADLFNSQNVRLQSAAAQILGMLKPAPLRKYCRIC